MLDKICDTRSSLPLPSILISLFQMIRTRLGPISTSGYSPFFTYEGSSGLYIDDQKFSLLFKTLAGSYKNKVEKKIFICKKCQEKTNTLTIQTVTRFWEFFPNFFVQHASAYSIYFYCKISFFNLKSLILTRPETKFPHYPKISPLSSRKASYRENTRKRPYN